VHGYACLPSIYCIESAESKPMQLNPIRFMRLSVFKQRVAMSLFNALNDRHLELPLATSSTFGVMGCSRCATGG
jgi:hypothetical protein